MEVSKSWGINGVVVGGGEPAGGLWQKQPDNQYGGTPIFLSGGVSLTMRNYG